MVRSGVGDLEVAITSGSQEVLNNLHMGFKLERLYDGCRYLAEAGFRGQSHPELFAELARKKRKRRSCKAWSPTRWSRRSWAKSGFFPSCSFWEFSRIPTWNSVCLKEGYLSAGYNPLMLTPTSIRKLLYNPAPLNTFIAKACLRPGNGRKAAGTRGRWTGSLSQTATAQDDLCRQELDRGIEGNSGRDALLSLEEILRSRRAIDSSSATGAAKDRHVDFGRFSSLTISRSCLAICIHEPVLSFALFQRARRQPINFLDVCTSSARVRRAPARRHLDV